MPPSDDLYNFRSESTTDHDVAKVQKARSNVRCQYQNKRGQRNNKPSRVQNCNRFENTIDKMHQIEYKNYYWRHSNVLTV